MKSPDYSTPTLIRVALLRTVSELIDYDCQAFYQWQSERLGNELFLSDPERATRIYDAAENGADGSTHAEHISDFQDYADEHYETLSNACDRLSTDSTDAQEITAFEAECKALENEIESAHEALDADLAKLEQWHAENGSLHQQVG